LRQVEPLASEQPGDILRFFARLGEIHSLGLVEDRVFITRVLPLVRGGLLQFLGGCLRERSSWEACKLQLLEEYFPHFVRVPLIRDLIVFNFHGEGQPLRVYIDLVFQAADFLQYEANEQQLVERVLMNLHPRILGQAAFLEKPRCRKELYRLVGLMEERFSIMQERNRSSRADVGANDSESRGGSFARGRPRGPTTGPIRCWDCGQLGHTRRACPRNSEPSGNVPRPGG
jgi:hypothetical protein